MVPAGDPLAQLLEAGTTKIISAVKSRRWQKHRLPWSTKCITESSIILVTFTY